MKNVYQNKEQVFLFNLIGILYTQDWIVNTRHEVTRKGRR